MGKEDNEHVFTIWTSQIIAGMFVQLHCLIGLLSSQNYEQYKRKTARLFFSSCRELGENLSQKQFSLEMEAIGLLWVWEMEEKSRKLQNTDDRTVYVYQECGYCIQKM